MRKVCYSVAMSLDGYITGPEGEIDWIMKDPDFDFRELIGRFDTLVMGRKTYEFAAAMGGGELFASLLDSKLVDSVRVAVIPVLLGGGLNMLAPAPGRTRLTLLNQRAYAKTGMVMLDYAVAK